MFYPSGETLPDPFRGDLFDSLFSDAVATVTRSIRRAIPDLEETTVSQVMLSYLYFTAVEQNPLYTYANGPENILIVGAVARKAGTDLQLTETILAEVEIQTVTGGIPSWFIAPDKAVEVFKDTQKQEDALKPSLVERTLRTILGPFGIDAGTLSKILQYVLFIGILIAVLYLFSKIKG
jgi:hypothetical protein